MDIKAFLREPTKVLDELALEPAGTVAQELLRQADEVKSSREQLKQLKKDKSAVARKFKAVESGATEHKALIARMQEVSDAYKSLEEAIKQREKALRSSLSAIVQSEQRDPPLFRVPPDSHYQGPVTVRELSSQELPPWFAFVAQQINAPAYCRAPWPEVIYKAFSNPTRVWAAVSEQGDILGGVPLTIFDSRLFGRFAVSVPYFNYGAVLTPYFNVIQSIFEHLQNICESERLSHIEVRTMQPDLGPPSVSKKVSMILPLPKTEARLDEKLGAKVRAQSKKAEPFNPEIRFGGLELLDDFYRVFAINMRDLGTPVYAKGWFREILDHPDIAATLAVVYVRGQAVSTGFLVGHNGMLEIPWASTVKTANAMDVNMWMYRQILDFAVREGYEFFDFGRSTRDAGTYRFKKQWGAQPYEHHWYYLLPEGGEMPGLNPDNPKYQLIISAWKRLPVWLTKIIGPSVVKNLP